MEVNKMNSMIFNPNEEYDSTYRTLHFENTKKYLEDLVQRAGVDIEENRKTVKEYKELSENFEKLKKKFFWWRVLRVIMCITLILIPLVVIKVTPIIRKLREDIEFADKRLEELLALAHQQMAPLNNLFTDKDCLRIIESTIPMISFAPCFSVEQEANMIINYDFDDYNSDEQSTLDVLAGSYNENPFLFENKIIHRMGTEVYHGYLTITWTETYRDSNGNVRTVTKSETLHATVTKPKPFYHSQVVLNYCAQGGPDLSFSRDATHLETKSDREIERYIKKGEKALKKMTDKALKRNEDFQSMSNSGFEVLFDALDRTNELQYRTLFTPLAQTNMVELIRSKIGYGDDFNFFKNRKTNRIVSEHSQGRVITVSPSAYVSYDFDVIKDSFINTNTDFFKAVYFDFAPLWAIPMYQERPVHSLQPIPNYAQKYSFKECETLANRVGSEHVVHPLTKTKAILKSAFVESKDGVDEICVSAYSYDILQRVDYVSMYGGDGRWHDVPVPWDEYIPLTAANNFFVATDEIAAGQNVIAHHNNLSIFN